MPFSEPERDVITSHSGLVLSHTMHGREIWRAYRSQALWVALTIAFGLLISSLFPAARSGVDCETDEECHQQQRQHEGLETTIAVAVGVEIAILVAFVVVSSAAHEHAGSLRHRLPSPSAKVEKHLRKFLAPIAMRIGVTREFALRIDQRAHHWAPSVAEDRQGVILVVPLGLVKVMATDPKAAESVFAHELGHIYEGDSWIFPTQAAHARMYRMVVAPAIFGLFLLSLVTSSPITISRWALIGAVVSARRAKQHLQAGRFASEERADAYACIVSGAEIARVLDEYVQASSRPSKYHPGVTERKLSISESLRQLQRLTNPLRATTAPTRAAAAAFDLGDLLNDSRRKQ